MGSHLAYLAAGLPPQLYQVESQPIECPGGFECPTGYLCGPVPAPDSGFDTCLCEAPPCQNTDLYGLSDNVNFLSATFGVA